MSMLSLGGSDSGEKVDREALVEEKWVLRKYRNPRPLNRPFLCKSPHWLRASNLV